MNCFGWSSLDTYGAFGYCTGTEEILAIAIDEGSIYNNHAFLVHLDKTHIHKNTNCPQITRKTTANSFSNEHSCVVTSYEVLND